jgi:hypothetical protein
MNDEHIGYVRSALYEAFRFCATFAELKRWQQVAARFEALVAHDVAPVHISPPPGTGATPIPATPPPPGWRPPGVLPTDVQDWEALLKLAEEGS